MTKIRFQSVIVVVFIVLCTKFNYIAAKDVTDIKFTSYTFKSTDSRADSDSKQIENNAFQFEYLKNFTTDALKSTKGKSKTVFTTEERTTHSLCQTDNDALKNMVIIQENMVKKIKWEKPTSEECNKYAVSINGNNPKMIDTNSFELKDISSSYCTKLDISRVDTTNNILGKVVTREIPGEILSLEATPDVYEISLTWDPPEDASCVTNYFIYLNGEKCGETAETTFTITEVEACTTHKVEVSAVSSTNDEGPKAAKNAKTKKPTVFHGKVENLSLNPSLTKLRATWDPPAKTGACIYRYSIQVWNQHTATDSYSTTETYFDIEPIVPCTEYNFFIIPQLSEAINGGDTTESAFAEPQVTGPPVIQDKESGKETITLRLKVTDYTVNMCQITQIEINCLFSGDQLLDWMVPEVADSIPYSDSSSRPPTDITVNGFSPYTDYSCEISVVNTAGKSDPTQIDVKTIEDVPSEPLNLQTKQEDEEINISWDEPYTIPGVLKEYKISVTYEASHHFIPKSCEISKGDVTDVPIQEKNYLFTNFVPNSKYSVNVQAQTGAGYGNAATGEVSTNPEASQPVRYLDYNINNYSTEEYDVSVEIAWQIPCNTNGNLVKFVYNIGGISLENDELLEIVEGEIKPNENIENEDYSFEIQDIKPWVNYTIQIYAVTSGLEEIKGEIDVVIFTSPEGWPSAPQNVVVDGITSTYGNIQWEEPEIKNGEIKKYQIDIKSEKPLHTVPNIDCNVDHVDNVSVGGNNLNYEYNEFLPNYEYKVSVKAETSMGFGDPKNVTFETKTAPSEKVRSIETELITTSNENYEVTLQVNFLQPCHLNGEFNFYKFTINGSRSGFEDHVEEKQLTEYSENSLSLSLKPEYEYEGFIEVITEEKFISEASHIQLFTSPAGVPKEAVIELQEPNSIESKTAKFELNRDTFSNEMGEIIHYAIILAPENFDPEENYGITNGIWPEIGHWSKDGELKEYQTTPKEWNPFTSTKRKSRSSEYTFTIGEDDCKDKEDYCNGPLRPDTAYSLRVRGFTTFGYRDTPKIVFSTPSGINGALIGGIVGGAAALILIFIIIIVFWRKRKVRNQVENTTSNTNNKTEDVSHPGKRELTKENEPVNECLE